MSRYPYTEAADALRVATADWSGEGADMSRAQASRLRQFVADAIGMDDEELARRIADYKRNNP